MSYNSFLPANSGLGMPTAGYATRGKANGLKRLSVASPPKVGSINEDEVDNGSTPSRGSRLNMLAGLRTAPRTPSVPTSAPFTQTQHNVSGHNASNYATQRNLGLASGMPHTAIGSTFPTAAQQLSMNPGQQFYALPDQVMTPPAIQINEDDQLDPNYVAQIQAQKKFFDQRAQALQQQFAQLGLAQRQLQQQYPATPNTPQNIPGINMSLYQQQLWNGTAPIPIEVPGQPGMYVVYNPLTGQYTCVLDPAAQLANSPPPQTPEQIGQMGYPFSMEAPAYREVTSPVPAMSPAGRRSVTPPKQSPSPPAGNVEPLPPKSATAWRPSHRVKLASLTHLGPSRVDASLKSSGLPATPTTGTFGPGGNRVGEHPDRQPRHPPSLDDLKAKPTTKHEGSKNFSVRTRRKALGSLRRAGFERRVIRDSGSAGSMTPVSETELTFSVPSDNDSDSIRSGSASLSGEPSPGLPPPGVLSNGAIGSERKASRGSNQLTPTSESGGSDFMEAGDKQIPVQRRAPLLNLVSAAEKRKSGMF